MTSKEALKKLMNYLDLSLDSQEEKEATNLLNIIKQDIERKEQFEKENKELREDKKALIKNANCCDWHDCIEITKENEKLKKENQELKKLVESLHKEQIIQAERIFDLEIENEKLKKAIKFLSEQLGLDVDLENHNLITDDTTIAFVNADNETMSVLELLEEVLEE